MLHDASEHMKSEADLLHALKHADGLVDTGLGFIWEKLRALKPDLRIATVRREIPYVINSMYKFGIPYVDKVRLADLSQRLDTLELEPSVLRSEFTHLKTELACAGIFSHCLGIPHDHAWWFSLSGENLQVARR